MGGLGDVVTGLARACLERGHDVEVLLPFYECLPTDQIEGLTHDMDFDCPKARDRPFAVDAHCCHCPSTGSSEVVPRAYLLCTRPNSEAKSPSAWFHLCQAMHS